MAKPSRAEAATSRRLEKAWGFLGVGAISGGENEVAMKSEAWREAQLFTLHFSLFFAQISVTLNSNEISKYLEIFFQVLGNFFLST